MRRWMYLIGAWYGRRKKARRARFYSQMTALVDSTLKNLRRKGKGNE